MPRDAVPIPPPPAGTRRVNPRASRIWIRVDGRWLPGHIQKWYRLPDGSWGLWLCYQADPQHATVAPTWGNYLFEPETILDAERYPKPPSL